jgi:hypothetical protein
MKEKIEGWIEKFEKWRRRPLGKVAMIVAGGVVTLATALAGFVFNAMGGTSLLCPYAANFCAEVELSQAVAWVGSLDQKGLCEERFKNHSWNKIGSKDYGLGPPGGGTWMSECGTIDLAGETGLGKHWVVKPSRIRSGPYRRVVLLYSARYHEISRDIPFSGRVTCGVRPPGRSTFSVVPCGVADADRALSLDVLAPVPDLNGSFTDVLSAKSPVIANRWILGIQGQSVTAAWPVGEYEVAIELGGAGGGVRKTRITVDFTLE